MNCPFCRPDGTQVFLAGAEILGIWDAFPVSVGHALLVTKRHVASWFEATESERTELIGAIDAARREVLARHRTPPPDGFNIGINVGAAAGQTVLHLHVHVIPRWTGDVPDPRGGVRHVIPARGNYLTMSDPREVPPGERDAPEGRGLGLLTVQEQRLLVRGEDDPLLPHLTAQLADSTRVDIAVAFIQRSGVARIEPHLRDFLARGGRARILTGDYLDITDPNALRQLLDLAETLPALPGGRGGALELRIFESAGVSFHPKVYVFRGGATGGTAYVGSSNLTESALTHGVEWNYRVVPEHSGGGFAEICHAFEDLFQHAKARPIDVDWVDTYQARRRPETRLTVDVPVEPLAPPPEPHAIQQEALTALEKTRDAGNGAGLVVMATGLGKTWLAAFDSDRREFRRILFVAHREEILGQAMKTFRRIRPDAHLGLYTGDEKTPDAEVLFASIQTLGRAAHLQHFAPDAFDYLVVDEFHHAAARTYRRLIEHFQPRFLLGLTATPERTDGGDLLALCQENLVYRCDLFRAIELGLLSPFRYFGVPDEIDYRNIPWRSSRFDEEALTAAVATRSRAQNALEQWQNRGGDRTLGFCCSLRHAEFMADFFNEAGVRSVAVHSGDHSAPRAASLERLESGDLQVVFAVDMFNEGVDLPHVDTILMLRPTESRILWLQQFGRGLRKADGKDRVTVVDYIGNHRTFLLKPQTLFALGADHREIAQALEQIQAGSASLPPGCEVTYDLRAIEILKSLLRLPKDDQALRSYYEDFRERTGERPRAVEAFHDGYSPRAARKGQGSWIRFVGSMGDLTAPQREVLTNAGEFLDSLEITPMTRSFKMIVLLAMLNDDRFPGAIEMGPLLDGFARIVRRSAPLRDEVGAALDDPDALRRLLLENPVAAWVGGKGTGGVPFFRSEGDRFESLVEVPPGGREALQELTREIVDWRLAEYLDRSGRGVAESDRIVCKVSHTGGKPILFLPDREKVDGIPLGWTEVSINGEAYEANFAKVAVNVIRRPGEEANALPAIVRGWFGADVGLPGTEFRVAFEAHGDGYRLVPLGKGAEGGGPELWRAYAREQIPALFGLQFRGPQWERTGFIREGQHMFLLVTLEKGAHPEEHRYEDRFLAPDRFQWQSQNRNTQAGGAGQAILHHVERGIQIHLFVRRESKIGALAAPFYYCGEVTFVDWEGEKPITVRWQLGEAVPERLRGRLALAP